MAKNLVIVESPAKAKTIENYLGKDFVVKSSMGHIRDLPSKGLAVDIEHGFEPKYEVDAKKKPLIAELKKLAAAAERVWLASDEDREGEAIAWHLLKTLELDEAKTHRIVFNEITKSAILKAIESPRGIDYRLVDAQVARRVLDRLVGYELSPVLWKKVKPSLSAGRVQSVAVRLIADREREREQFEVTAFFKVQGKFADARGKSFKAELPNRLSTELEAQALLEKLKSAQLTVGAVEVKPLKRSPSAPFTTSTLQQEAARKLGFSVARTMSVAQKLYENGKITYMRTDSVNLSDFARDAARQAVEQIFGAEYHKERNFSNKAKGAQEAHESIRPTDFTLESAGEDASEKKLYELIRKRALASQMADAKLEKTTVKLESNEIHPQHFVARGEVITFKGFLTLYMESKDEDEEDEELDQAEQLLPAMKTGEPVTIKEISATERFTQPPSRYSEAALVKKMEELGIGRPSTYAPTISVIQGRGYVEKAEREGVERKYTLLKLQGKELKKTTATERTGADKGKLFPTDIGMVTNDFLVAHFAGILDFHFTAKIEKQFDEIAEGHSQWSKMIEDFYGPFHQAVKNTESIVGKASGKRQLGIDPQSGKPVFALVGRYGPMIQIGEAEDEDKPRFSSLQKEQSIQTISLDEALSLFKLPRTLGDFEEKTVVVGQGRFGPYVRHNSQFVSIPKEQDPLALNLEDAIALIHTKREADANKRIKVFEENTEVQILNGRWGPYIAVGKDNVKIPKGKTPEQLSLQDCLDLHKAQGGSKKKGRTAKK
ncbi:MAG: type I DNA topoisomerase [Bacteroidia bacterium]|jgi:DNA topoisomerase-1